MFEMMPKLCVFVEVRSVQLNLPVITPLLRVLRVWGESNPSDEVLRGFGRSWREVWGVDLLRFWSLIVGLCWFGEEQQVCCS